MMSSPLDLSARLCRQSAAGLTAAMLLSCAAGEPIEGELSPGAVLVGLQLSPDTATVAADGTLQLAVTFEMSDGSTPQSLVPQYDATGGTVTPAGVFVAGHQAGAFRVIATFGLLADTTSITIPGDASPDLVRLNIDPGSAALLPGATQRFTASGVFSDSSIIPLSVDYRATGGSISSNGNYTAGQGQGLFQVIASLKDGQLADTARVEIVAPPPGLVRVELTPASANLTYGQSLQFSAAGRLSDSTLMSLPVTWTATGGTVSSSGNYTAGTTAGTYRIIARASGGLADTSTIVVAAPVIASLNLTPAVANLQVGQQQQFAVTATLSNGSTQQNPAVTYTFTGGLMTQGGLYTAGLIPGTYQVIARTANGVADTSTVNISLAILTALNIAPISATVQTGQTFQFGVTALLNNGGTQINPDVTWTTTSGTVSGSGLFTAGSTPGTVSVRATSTLTPLSATATVNVVAAPPPNMFFNSAEAGCGTDSNVLLCDDFEDGDWYTKNCDQANASGGLLQTDGWCGTIYGPITPALCDNNGFRSNCAASHGTSTGAQGNVTMADHSLAQGVQDVYIRFYTKPLAGYRFGAEKLLSINKGPAGVGGIFWGNLHINCGMSPQSTGTLQWQPTGSETGCRNIITLNSGRWYFVELHMNVRTGVLQAWADDCGGDGLSCPSTPTLRLNLSNFRFQNTTDNILSLWFENWANPGSAGTRLLDNIKVSRVGPIGFSN